jgi:hypothetical protein
LSCTRFIPLWTEVRCETWSLNWRRNVGWWCWGRRLGLGGTWKRGSGEDYISRSFMNCMPHHMLAWSNKEVRWVGHVARGREMLTGYGWEDLMETDYLKDLGIDGRIILKRIFETRVGLVWTGFIWLTMWTGTRSHSRLRAHTCADTWVGNTCCFSTARRDSWKRIGFAICVHCLSCLK